MLNRRELRYGVVLLLCAVSASAAPSFSDPTVDLGYAKFIGTSNSTLGVNLFRGIHYAAPPTGHLRWQRPVPIEKQNNYTTEYVNATKYGPQCLQARPGWEMSDSYSTPNPSLSPASEDCLVLDVLTPIKPQSSPLPVIVNIHGGGYIGGNTSQVDGTQLVSYADGGVIIVQLQYRLGALGFLGGEEIKANGSLNAGLLDQRLALLWVQNHIAAFGGDPNQVTIWGGSAGGGSVMYQLTYKGGEDNPPFRAAIPEYPALVPHKNETIQQDLYELVLKASGCASLQCLRDLPFENLAEATQQSYDDGFRVGLYGYSDFCYTPVVDGSFVKDLPSRQYAAGNFSRVPILTDTDAFEGLGFANSSVRNYAELKRDYQAFWPAATADFWEELLPLYGPQSYGLSFFGANFFQSTIYPIVMSLLGTSDNETGYWAQQDIWGDYAIKCPSRFVAAGAFDTVPKVPIWKLVFNAGYFAHGATAPYLLGAQGAPLTFNTTLQSIMKDYWLAFVINGDPNKSLPNGRISDRPWFPQYGAEDDVLQINETSIGRIADPDNSARCAFYESNADVTLN